MEVLLRHFAILSVLGLLLTACGDSTAPSQVEEVTIDLPNLLAVDDTVQATATVFGPNGSEIPGASVIWASLNEAVATVTSEGVIVGLAHGSTSITATSDGVVGEALLSVSSNPCDFAVGELAIGDSVEGELTEESCFFDLWFHDPWLLELDDEHALRIDMTSPDFDTFILVTDVAGNGIAEDHDSGENDTSRIEHLFAPGQYIVWASTFVENETGLYDLSLEEMEDGSSATLIPLQSMRMAPPPPLGNGSVSRIAPGGSRP